MAYSKTPAAPPKVEHPPASPPEGDRKAGPSRMAAVLGHLLAARDLLLEAADARGDRDATEDAGHLAAALVEAGGALADEQQPWPLQHALERNKNHADPDGVHALELATSAVATALRHGARRKALGLGPQAGLALFARLASKCATQREARIALEAAHREQEQTRQRADQLAHEKRGTRPAAPITAKPVGPEPPETEPEEEWSKV